MMYVGWSGSNNTAELTAIGEALIWLAHHCREIEADRTRCGFGPVVVRYDSDYAAKSVMGVYNGKKNVELIGQVRQVYADAQAALQSMRRSCGAGTANNGIKFSHVKGHSGHRWNERADELANLGLHHTLRPEMARPVVGTVRVPHGVVPAEACRSVQSYCYSSGSSVVQYFQPNAMHAAALSLEDNTVPPYEKRDGDNCVSSDKVINNHDVDSDSSESSLEIITDRAVFDYAESCRYSRQELPESPEVEFVKRRRVS